MRVFTRLLTVIVLVAGVSACGGGGGSSSSPIVPVANPTAAPATQSAILRTSQKGATTTTVTSGWRSTLSSPAPSPTPILSGSQFVLFTTPDSYVKGTPPISNYAFTLFAYLDTSNGSTLPSTLPTLTWTITGQNLVYNQVDPTQTMTGLPAGTFHLGYYVKGPNAAGSALFTASANAQTSPFYVNTYVALGISADPKNSNGFPSCLTFGSDGLSHPATPPQACDLSISESTGLQFPGGGVLLSQSRMPTITIADWSNQRTSLPNDQVSYDALLANANVLLFKTNAGYLVKLMISATIDDPYTTPGKDFVQGIYGGYRVSSPALIFDF